MQASLQIFIMLNDGFNKLFEVCGPAGCIPVNIVLRIASAIISCLSLFYGLSKIDMRRVSAREPETCLTIKVFLVELPRKIALFLRVLICVSLYYNDENMYAETFAIIYTCLDFLPVIVFVFWFNDYNLKDTVLALIKLVGIKSILDPSRISFMLSDGAKKPDDWRNIVLFNSLFTIWYSLLGIIFPFIFIDTLPVNCNFFCDRFLNFFISSIVIYVLAFIYSCTTCFFAMCDKPMLKPVFPEDQKEEETNV